ncbi:MAG: guanylate kinase [Ktedonobacteraceae bacterium]
MHIETGTNTSQQDSLSIGTQTTMKQGLLFVLSAPSGAGKDTVIGKLRERGVNFHVVSSVTTRTPRKGESDGHPYHFVSEETFQRMVQQNELLEYANVYGNWYGQPLQQIQDNLRMGHDVLLKIDVQGAATVRRKVAEAIFIFLMPGSTQEQVERLTSRQTETEEEQARRLAAARAELAQSEQFEYVIVNRQGQLEEAVTHLHAIMLAEHCRTKPRYMKMKI